MPTARETLLEAAHAAAGAQPWSGVRMVDVAAAAGVSRQTLYNEFGSKEGLGAVLVDRLVGGFLDGAVRVGAESARAGMDSAACCAAAAAWMLRTARDEPIVHAALTGCWGARMPLPAAAGEPPADFRPGDPGELAAVLCDRLVAGLPADGAPGSLRRACGTGLRVALSYVVAPSGQRSDEEALGAVREVVRALLAQPRGVPGGTRGVASVRP